MKHLKLTNSSFEHLQKGFYEWTQILGYSKAHSQGMATICQEFLYFLEQKELKNIQQINHNTYKQYYHRISNRSKKRKDGALSNNSINKHLQALEKFIEYLHHKGAESTPTLNIKLLKLPQREITYLNQTEIKTLYQTAETIQNHPQGEIISTRDLTLLSIFYACGLRRNEGAKLKLQDINFDTRVLHVKYGKKYKERLVPMSKSTTNHIKNYAFNHRPLLVKSKTESALFISKKGLPASGDTLYKWLKKLQERSELESLQNKQIGLHTLRHSIATHLLENGMGVEKIARFLGHATLESTQIYTHLNTSSRFAP